MKQIKVTNNFNKNSRLTLKLINLAPVFTKLFNGQNRAFFHWLSFLLKSKTSLPSKNNTNKSSAKTLKKSRISSNKSNPFNQSIKTWSFAIQTLLSNLLPHRCYWNNFRKWKSAKKTAMLLPKTSYWNNK